MYYSGLRFHLILFTLHRLIFKHMVMTKAKLGQSVQMSIQKFKVSDAIVSGMRIEIES